MWKKDKADHDDADQQTADENGQDGAAAQAEDVIAFVGKGVEFKGIITYNGTVRIDGQLDGEIHTDGTLLVGEDAVLTAKVSAGTVISKGRITGDISAKEKVRLLSPAILNGSVKAPTISMEEGVLFNGSIEMARAEVRELSREAAVRAVNAPASGMKRVTG
jgi:cytoskeletal protein CcmA (bactofilin family)